MPANKLFLVLLFSFFTPHLQGQFVSKNPNDLVLQVKEASFAPETVPYRYKVEYRNLNRLELPEVYLEKTQTEICTQKIADTVQLSSDFVPEVQLTMERKQAKAVIFIPQFIRRKDGTVHRLLSYQLRVVEKNGTQNKTSGSRVYAAHSVLANGSWSMLSVSHDGLYKVDYAFIQNQLGIDPSGINPSQIQVFGNGGQLLPENNAIVPADDLIENAIEVHDGGDGQFNPGDYFLFYASGPHRIYLSDTANHLFSHEFNIYSETSAYFVRFNSAAGKRIAFQGTAPVANTQVYGYNDFYFTEKDSSNPGKFGKTWWGDEFSDLPGRYMQRNYYYNFPGLDLSVPVTVRCRFGAISSSGNSFVQVTANGSSLFSNAIGPVGGTFSDPVTRWVDKTSTATLGGDALTLNISFSKGSVNASGFLDFIEVNCRRQLKLNGYTNFTDLLSVGSGQVATYHIQQANAQSKVWDITDPLNPVQMNSSLSGSELTFSREAYTVHRFIAFDESVVYQPVFSGHVANQDLHALAAADNIIICPDHLKPQAQVLAAHHLAKRNIKSLIVSPQEIYNEFSSGTQDVSAIRNFLKMYYDRSSSSEMPRNVLMLGDASYDYKNRLKNNTNWVPTYQTYESNDKITGYCTDDFFGFLDDNEDINSFASGQINTLDIGVGRIPVSTAEAARAVIDKIKYYDSEQSLGSWKNSMTFNADDGNDAVHMEDGEIMSQYAIDSLPDYNPTKIYVDGFVEQSTPAGPRTPDANQAIRSQIFNGTFLMNYNGHGGPLGWCEERIFSMDDVNLMTNLKKLPLFITATCDFAPYDDPASVSAGEILLNKSDGGAIALMTTTRLVYQDQNREMNLNYMASGFKPMANGAFPSLGEAWRLSKNLRYVNYVGQYAAANFRKFALLGDPALPLAFPKYRVHTDSMNGVSVNVSYDTLKALGKYTISGHISDQNGTLLSDFNGYVYPTILDKPKKLSTLQNGTDNPKRDYYVQNNTLYKGKASVKNGKFSFTFVVPKDINYQIANGKISYYAENGIDDAAGNDKKIWIGGSSSQAGNDLSGPMIKAYLNNEKFVNGGITTPNSTLILKLSDDNGINYTGNSVGHDITATLDGNAQGIYVLNSFFEADVDDYRSGSVNFPLSNLSVGKHTLRIKAWDISNNSSEAELQFEVVSDEDGQLSHVYNYPNPFTTSTRFMFEHNMPNQPLQIDIKIFSATGKVVRQIQTQIQSEGTRVDQIEWDGRDMYGDKLAKGVYVYKITVHSKSGQSDSKYQKLVLLN